LSDKETIRDIKYRPRPLLINVLEVFTLDDIFLGKVNWSEIPEEGDINDIRNHDQG
jgi:hypothetical protein